MTIKPTICFAHANGFPGPTYRKLFSLLETTHKIDAIDNVGHGEYPVTDNWQHIAHELELYIRQKYDEPIIGIGHSLGGVLHLITSLKSPELYQQVILLDSPLYGPIKSVLLKLFKRMGWMAKITPSRSSARRRNHWHNKAEALAYFKTKQLFKSFDLECLQDYVDYGMQQTDDGVKLVTEPEIEGKVFENLPDNLWWRRPKVPTSYICASNSHVISSMDKRFLRLKYPVFDIQGGHLFPFERPQETAALLRQLC